MQNATEYETGYDQLVSSSAPLIPIVSTSTRHRRTGWTTAPPFSTLPNIWDRLAAAGLNGRYYYNDVLFTTLWGSGYLNISRPYAEFLAGCATGTLPNVSFVDSRFKDETNGTSAEASFGPDQ